MSSATALIVFPLSAAVLFAFSAMALKRASHLGVSVWQSAFAANLVAGVCYSALWGLGGPPVVLDELWQPALIALCMFLGMGFQFLALDRGDVSVTVPVLGLKVLLVAFITPVLVGETVRPELWLAGCLSVAGVTLLNRKERGTVGSGRGVTLASAGAASVCFAVFDVLVQKWGPPWGGAGRLLPFVFWMNAGLSLLCLFWFRAPLKPIPSRAWRWLLMGTLLMSAQSILFVACLAVYGKAAAANIIYSARGLASVVLVWTIGHWFGNEEKGRGKRVLQWRLAGAVLMLGAIVTAALKR